METARKRPTMGLSKTNGAASAQKPAPVPMDPHWAWAERAAAARDEALRESLSIEARARLKLLQRAAANFAAKLPSVPEYMTFLRTEIIPVYNTIMSDEPMCLECGKRVARKKAARAVCSPECASRLAGHPRKGSGRGTLSPQEQGETAKISLNDIASAIGVKKLK
jgi:hypothetical protein